MSLEHWKQDSIQGFCADVLLPKVEHYRSDVFITYERLVRLREDDAGVILTRRNGCEEYTQQSAKTTFDGFDCWAPEATGFFYIRRCHEESYFGRIESVRYQQIPYERAKLLVALLQHRINVSVMEPIYVLRYPLYTGDQIRQLLILNGVKCENLAESQLEQWGETVNLSMCKYMDKDMLQDKTTQQRVFLMMLMREVESVQPTQKEA